MTSLGWQSFGHRAPFGHRARLGRQIRLLSTAPSKGIGRKPLPPMPRVLPVSSQQATVQAKTTTGTVTAEKSKGGTVLIRTGWFLMGLIAVDQIFQYMDQKEAKETIEQLRKEEEKERKQFFDSHKDLPTLHESVVKFEYKMSGTRGLKGVRMNDRLEVVEEGVGPNGTYATCRRRDATGAIVSIGWYPLSFQQKIEQKEPRRKLLGLF